MIVATIDIGSTWTKGAAFQIEQHGVSVLRRGIHPTTTDNLSRGFFAVLEELVPGGKALALIQAGEVRLAYSSSAKGGLAVAAIGLVPEVTLELGKVAAQSAGAKLSQVFSYLLTKKDIALLEASPPDILLFAGGTDGGNTSYVLANAEAISRSTVDCEIIYAGNRSVADEVAELLAEKKLTVTENLLPNFDEPNPEPARKAIRSIFLKTIVKGKGLDIIMQATGEEPLPTPFAMYEYVQTIHMHVPGWQDFMLLDMGGATTDVYSAHTEIPEAGTILRGLPEPVVKRTVEGDLGMRVCAQSTVRVGKPVITAALEGKDAGKIEDVLAYADRLAAQPEYLPENLPDILYDTLLAGACVGFACARHVGRHAEVYTPDGAMLVQTGRNLTNLTKVIGAGGWLSRAEDFSLTPWFAAHAVDQRGRAVLLPRQIEYYRDEECLFPLLANLARFYPEAAAKAGICMLNE